MPDIKYKKGTQWNRALTPKMKQFEKETGKSSIYRGAITGNFEYWLWMKEKKQAKKVTPKKRTKQIPKKKTISEAELQFMLGAAELKANRERDEKIARAEIELKKRLRIKSSTSKSAKIYLEFHGVTATGGVSKKFYEIYRLENTVYIRYGRIGSTVRKTQTSYNTPEDAQKQMDKTVNSKLAKGYREKKKLTKPEHKIKPSKPTSKRISPMLAGQGEHLLGNPDYILQQKYDGTRCIIIKKNNTIKMISRSWKSNYAASYPEIVRDIGKIQLNSFILDSELTFFKGNTDIFLTALATEESKKNYIAKCMVFDILEYNNKNTKNLPLRDRNKLLYELIPGNLRYLKVVKSYKTNHKQIFEDIISDKRQGEGVVLKRLDSIYNEGGRTRDWVKVKGWKSDEAIVVGVTHGTGARSATFGSLILAQYDRKVLIFVGKASGFKMSEQEQLINMLKPYITKDPQFIGMSDKYVKYWTKPKIVIEVKYQEKTVHGKFRFPSFMRFRHDKSPRECILER